MSSIVQVPPTANLHLVPHCNYGCRFCYVTFPEFSPHDVLHLDQIDSLLAELARHGVRFLTLAGGEPTLHPQLSHVLRRIAAAGLVPSVVTNARRIDEAWIREHGPFLRWLAVSCDSPDDAISDALGRRLKSRPGGHAAHVREVFELVRSWNSIRPLSRRIRTKLNMVITALNAAEDPRDFLRACSPDRLKLFQLLPVAGENDAAADLLCPDDAFAAYAARVSTLAADGIDVVAERNEDMTGSYLMIDPKGRLFQLQDGRYVTSRPILEVGLVEALRDVGGVDLPRFEARGGLYDHGAVPDGNRPYLIAIEGLDGSGKSTVARALAERLGGELIENPPRSWRSERAAADCADETGRRAFYTRGNRAALAQAETVRAAGRAVVMDRSFASTLAYGEATAGRIASPAGWPADVERPDLILLLIVAEDVRRARIAARDGQTAEERALATDHGFRGRVLAGFRALGAVDVDAGQKLSAVVWAVEDRLHVGRDPLRIARAVGAADRSD